MRGEVGTGRQAGRQAGRAPTFMVSAPTRYVEMAECISAKFEKERKMRRQL